MRLRKSILFMVLAILLAQIPGALASSTLCAFDCSQDCAGGCGIGQVGIAHSGLGFLSQSGFDLRGTSFADTCNSPELPNGCPARGTPPVRWWAWNHFDGANSGCQPLYDAVPNSYISSVYDVGNGLPPGTWWLDQAQWTSATNPGPDRVDGCIFTEVTNPAQRRTVAELSFEDAFSKEGTTHHDSWYLIAGVAENSTGLGSYDFEAITGAGGSGNLVAVSSVPDVVDLVNAVQGNADCSSSDSATATIHPRSTVHGAYFDVTLQVSDAAPPYYNEAGRNAGDPLISGLQVVYTAGLAPTSSDPSVAGWKPARHPDDPAGRVSALIPHGGATSAVVSLPIIECANGCWLAVRIAYQDDSVNPGLPWAVVDVDAPRLVSLTGQHCGPVKGTANQLSALSLTTSVRGVAVVNPGDPVSFDTSLANLGSQPLVGGILGDTLPACVGPLGPTGNPCPTSGVPSVACVGAACASTQCTISNGGKGFLITGIDLPATDGAAGGDDELLFSVQLRAEAATGSCENVAGILDPVVGVITSTSELMVVRPISLYWVNSQTGDTAQWVLDPQYQIRSASYLPRIPDSAWLGAAVGDLAGDGRNDLIWRHSTTGDNAIWTVAGSTVVSSTYLPSIDSSDAVITDAADFNGDGRDDLLWRNTATGDTAVWYMNGATVTGGALLPRLSDTAWKMAGSADFNTDTQSDLLWWNETTGDLAVWYMNETALSSGAIIGRIPPTWEPVGVVAADGERAAVIVWRETGGANALWVMDGVELTSTVSLPAVGSGWYLAGAY